MPTSVNDVSRTSAIHYGDIPRNVEINSLFSAFSRASFLAIWSIANVLRTASCHIDNIR